VLLEAIVLGAWGARRAEVARLPVKASADVNLADGDRVSPLAQACRRGPGAIVTTRERAGDH
jgi:hypothetical protein